LASHGGNLATNYFLPVLVSYLVFSAGWTVSLIWRFANVPSEGESRRPQLEPRLRPHVDSGPGLIALQPRPAPRRAPFGSLALTIPLLAAPRARLLRPA